MASRAQSVWNIRGGASHGNQVKSKKLKINLNQNNVHNVGFKTQSTVLPYSLRQMPNCGGWLDGPTAYWSDECDDPLVRKPIGPTAHWSETPLVRKPIGSTTHWSEKVRLVRK